MPLSEDAKAHLEQLRIHAAMDQQVVIGVAIDTNTGEMTSFNEAATNSSRKPCGRQAPRRE